jgi:hypothetical protein
MSNMGRKKGGQNEGYSAYWLSLLGPDIAKELIDQAYAEIEQVTAPQPEKEHHKCAKSMQRKSPLTVKP